MAKEQQEMKPKGTWLPCGCRKDNATGKLVRVCAEHAEPKEAKK